MDFSCLISPVSHRGPELVGFEDPLQQLTILWLGPDDPIEKLTDFILERLALVHRRRMQKVLFPNGLVYDGEASRTPVTCMFFRDSAGTS